VITQSDYIGLDYGNGLSNIDIQTGVRYGIISVNHLDLVEWLNEDFEPVYGQHCPECCVELSTEDIAVTIGGDIVCPECNAVTPEENIYNDEPDYYGCENKEYELLMNNSNEIWVFRSPYFTKVMHCSPCAPGAGDLDHPHTKGIITYCLGPEWFKDTPPYPVYVIDGGQGVS
jgi:hypothetical protein